MRSCRVSAFVLLAALAWGLLCLPGTALAQVEMPEFPEDEAAAAAAGLGCACMVAILVIMVASFAVWIAVCVYVYRDANARGMENAVLWLILTILTGLIGLIIYLIVRPPKPGQGPPES